MCIIRKYVFLNRNNRLIYQMHREATRLILFIRYEAVTKQCRDVQ